MAIFKSKPLGPDMVQNLDMSCKIPEMSGQHSGGKLIKISTAI